METKEIEKLIGAYRDNLSKVLMVMPSDVGTIVAMAATVVDLLRNEIQEIRNEGSVNLKQMDQPPDGNGDPDSLATEVCKRLGGLGLENLTELKHYRIDYKKNKVLLQIRGRMADSGWKSDSPHFSKLKVMYETFGLPLTEIPQAETTVSDGESET